MKSYTIVMLLVLALGPILTAEDRPYTYTPLAVPPGATQTLAFGINDLGTIVGLYSQIGSTHGFVLQDGTYTLLDAPGIGGGFTEALGINVQGDIVVQYGAPGPGASHGFIRQGGVYITIDFPGPKFISRVSGINSRDEIVGSYEANDFTNHGYLYERDRFIVIDVPFPGVQYTYPLGINDLGDIVGDYLGSDGKSHSFLKQGSAFTSFDVPFPNTNSTTACGINNKGEIVGTYLDSGGGQHGFILAKGEFTRLDASIPGITDITGTQVFGINDLGEIVGVFARLSIPTQIGFSAKR